MALPWTAALCVLLMRAAKLVDDLDSQAKTAAVKLNSDLDSTNATLEAINAPCTSFHGSVSCGTMAQLAQTTKNFGIVAMPRSPRRAGEAERAAVITATAANINQVGARVSALADAGSETLQAANATIAKIGAKVPDTQPLVDAATKTAGDLDKTVVDADALVESPDVGRFMAASAETSVQVSDIAADVHKEADSLTAPQPWWKKLTAYGNTSVNVACLVTHSCPF